jgi:large subunit ribosomal protein L54
LKGLNYFKGRDDPVALKEDEYPEWLWRCLDAKKVEGEDDASAGDEFCESSMPFHFSFHQLNSK